MSKKGHINRKKSQKATKKPNTRLIPNNSFKHP